MYPKSFIEYFRNFDRTDEVFVAMPFSTSFNRRWKEIFVPAIDERSQLHPFRVDSRRVSDSILTDILRGVSQSKLILVDISVEENGMRNGNVMYELGLAHSIRMPEEVIIVRSDDEEIPFDINQVRVHRFMQDNIHESIEAIAGLISNAIREIDLTKDLIVENTAKELDPDCVYVMAMELGKNSFAPPLAQHGSYGHLNWIEARSLLRKLQELRVFEAFADPESKQIYYRWTPLGTAVAARLKDAITRISGK